ncbi:MAG TPA: hypothetical protein VHE13_08830, partial [Opitutus sp.]|nr:hypothetical protein [Opitutus sp.]
MAKRATKNPEAVRLEEDRTRKRNWQRWGPYLSERQWGTVREDYSGDSDTWRYFTHDDARSRAYRWGEDGLLGICDRECRLCFALALWNGRDPILKERLFGLTGPEGNHGEDVKECYFYLDATPTNSWLRALYKYPQAEFPYERLKAENRRRGRNEPEFELLDTGVFDGNRYFDVFAEYAKAAPDDICIKVTVANRGPDAARLHVLPTLWFRNTWSWGCRHEGCEVKPRMQAVGDAQVQCDHPSLGRFIWELENAGTLLFTENETNAARLFGATNASPFVRDAFHEHVVGGRGAAVNPARTGTKCAAHRVLELGAGEQHVWRLRLRAADDAPRGRPAFGAEFEKVFAERRREADEFYADLRGVGASKETQAPFGGGKLARTDEAERVLRQAYGGLL